WLAKNDAFWGFQDGKVMIRGQIFTLMARPKQQSTCNRVVVQDSVIVPAHSEAIIPTKIIFDADQIVNCKQVNTNQSDDAIGQLMIEPTMADNGLCVAGVLLPPR